MTKKWIPASRNTRYIPTHMAMGQANQASPFMKLLHMLVLGYGLYCLASHIGGFVMRKVRSMPQG